MTRRRIQALLYIGAALALWTSNSASAGNIFVETWEDPTIANGTSSTSLPPSWSRLSGPTTSSQIFHPSGTADFNQTGPLSSPAGGNQVLFLSGTNTGIYRMSGVLIQADATYTLSAAIGNDKQTSDSQHWSLQLWADTNGSGHFEGTGYDTFIGQQFGTTPSAINPSAGNWAWDSFTFNSSTTPSLVGQELIVFLNNFSSGTSYYDNVTLSYVPEPSSVVSFGVGVIGFVLYALARRGRKSANASCERGRDCNLKAEHEFKRTSVCAWIIAAFLGLIIPFFSDRTSEAGSFTLPATTGDSNKLDLGSFAGGTDLTITMSGTINIGSPSPWITNPDGSLAQPVTTPSYNYVNAGALGYPTADGGDGTNHFAGGGANYDVLDANPFGFTGKQTTDTTDPDAIRFGSVVGTFSASPMRGDWFFIGFGASVVVPTGGAHLYVAEMDTFYPNNAGNYFGTLTATSVPEPSSVIMVSIAIGVAFFLRYTGSRPNRFRS